MSRRRSTLDEQLAGFAAARAAGLPFGFCGVGVSMWPVLRPGDEALFAAATPPLVPGEVLIYRAGDALIAHRYLGAADGSLRLRGDLLDYDDPPVAPEAVLGRLVGIRRGGRLIWPAALGDELVARVLARPGALARAARFGLRAALARLG